MARRAGCVIICGDEMIVVHQISSGFWGFPKGSIEPGEDTLAAAIRETKEETGVEVNPKDICGSIRRRDSKYYIAFLQKKPKLTPSDWQEIDCCGWVTLAGLQLIPTSATTKFVIKHLIGRGISVGNAIADERWQRGEAPSMPQPKDWTLSRPASLMRPSHSAHCTRKRRRIRLAAG